jgi:hypothetical protein
MQKASALGQKLTSQRPLSWSAKADSPKGDANGIGPQNSKNLSEPRAFASEAIISAGHRRTAGPARTRQLPTCVPPKMPFA